jgi:hypothetical protein
MSLTLGNTIRFSAAVGLLSIAFAQNSKPQFTARELFYAAVEPPKTAAAKPVAAPAPKKKSAPPVAAPVAPDIAQVSPPAPPSRPVNISNPPPMSGNGGARIMTASAQTAPAPSAGPALGLKYTILKLVNGEMAEVPPTTVFHAGDRIQFAVQSNVPGYLYIISQGSSGTWKPLFPSPEVGEGNNKVEGWATYSTPPKARMVFDEQKGTERIFIVLSREPEPDLEKMIYSLQGGKPVPVSDPGVRPKQMVTFAQLNIPDSMVGKLRTTYARDLIIEQVTPQTPGERKETAVYVVNPSGTNDSRVVADLSLEHQ